MDVYYHYTTARTYHLKHTTTILQPGIITIKAAVRIAYDIFDNFSIYVTILTLLIRVRIFRA